MKQIKAVLADIDGTLIEGGDLTRISLQLKWTIQQARQRGIAFTLASGRPFFEQEDFFNLMTDNAKPLPNEGVIYEGSCVRLYGNPEAHRLGGLTREQIQEVEAFAGKNKLFEGMVHQANNERYETTTGYVTPTFRSEGRTDKDLLERTFQKVKPILEAQFPYLEAVMSADAIDLNAKGINKALPTKKYSEITGIPLENMAAIGDSGNDLPMLDTVGQAGGLVVYVGTKPEQEQIIRAYANHIIPRYPGPLGTIESLQHLAYFDELRRLFDYSRAKYEYTYGKQ